MSYGIKLKVWGDYASFNRPEMKVERVSYDVMTPSAARGILEAIHWKPGMRWVVDAIHVLAPIRFTTVRRNEISTKIPVAGASKAIRGEPSKIGIEVDDPRYRQPRAAMILRDVSYGIAAHIDIIRPDLDDNGKPLEHPEAKHLEAFKRRATKGQFHHQPYFGCREFPVAFELAETFPDCPEELRGPRPLGLMLHDIEYAPDHKGEIIDANTGERINATARFFPAVLNNGILNVPLLNATEEAI